MTRRAAAHDYTRPGVYHITLHVADGLGQVLGSIAGSLSAPDGSADAPHTALSAIGQMVEHELLHSIHSHYAMVTVQDYVIMPEHLHFIVVVQDKILSRQGKTVPLGTVIAGFKKGCNRRYWELTGQAASTPASSGQTGTPASSGQTAARTASRAPSGTAPSGTTLSGTTPSGSVSSGFPAGYKVPSNATTGRQPLFDDGYCDVMPVDAAQLATQRAYIAGNPRSRLLRMNNRTLLSVNRDAIHTALTPSALRGYLKRECPPALIGPEALAAIEARLILSDSAFSGSPAETRRVILCDSFGDRTLFTEDRCLPVVCHRKDAARFNEQKMRCLEEAAQGAVLVSACISPREREIITECVNHGFPVITIHDNGFPDRYHPSTERQELCAAGRLLLVSPWIYKYRGKNEQVTVPFCKTMNCVVQALCRKKDNWWKNQKRMNR